MQQNQEKKKIARKPSWTRDQTYLLASHVKDNTHIIKGKFSSNLTHVMKRNVWAKIANSLNAVYPMIQKTPGERERKWFT